jgi:hypothetical protein
MSREEWQSIYHEAWSLYYTPEHMRTLLRRAAATGLPLGSLARLLARFSLTDRLEHVHPLQGGILRLKHPSERRAELPREAPWLFWPRFVWQTLRTHALAVPPILRLWRWTRAVARDPAARSYTDLALTPVRDDDDALELISATAGGRAAVAHARRIADLTAANQAMPG